MLVPDQPLAVDLLENLSISAALAVSAAFVSSGLSPCRYRIDELVSARKEGRDETSTV